MSGRSMIFFCILILFIPYFAHAREPQPQPKRVSFDLEIRGSAWAAPCHIWKIDNIPLSLRKIPGDWYDRAIPQTSTTPRLLWSFLPASVGLAPQFTFNNRWVLRLGAWYSYPVSDAHKSSSGNTREINSSGTTKRGVGKALDYYATLYRPQPRPGLFSEIELRRKSGRHLVSGYMFNPYKIVFEKGTDTYDSLKAYSRQDLAAIDLHMPYFGVKWQNPDNSSDGAVTVFAGLIFNQTKIAPIGQEVNFQYLKPGFWVGINFSTGLGWIIREVFSQGW